MERGNEAKGGRITIHTKETLGKDEPVGLLNYGDEALEAFKVGKEYE